MKKTLLLAAVLLAGSMAMGQQNNQDKVVNIDGVVCEQLNDGDIFSSLYIPEGQNMATKRLLNAVDRCDRNGVKTALENGADPNAYAMKFRHAQKYYALMLAMRCEDDPEIPKMLISSDGIDLNVTDHQEATVLFYALINHSLENAELLVSETAIEKGFDINSPANVTSIALATGITRVGHGTKLGHEYKSKLEERINFLVNTLRFDINTKNDKKGQTLLMLAENNDVAKVLIAAGADVNIQDDRLKTALMYNAEDGYKDLVETLLNNGAIINMVNGKGDTAASLAKKRGHPEIVTLLQNFEAKHF